MYLGIEFYLFVSHGGMNDRGSTCKFRNARKFNPYIYTLSKLFRFGYGISVFKYITGRYSEQPPEQPAHTSRMFLHGKMDVKIFRMFIVAENTGSVNIYIYNFHMNLHTRESWRRHYIRQWQSIAWGVERQNNFVPDAYNCMDIT